MNDDLYNSINADVVANKQIQKATGMSPARERWKERNDSNYKSLLLKPVTGGWKTGWRIILSNTFIEDNMGAGLPIPRFYQLAHRDFNTNSFHYFPVGISQLVAIGYWAWYHSYSFIKNLRAWEFKERRIKMNLDEAYRKGHQEGRDFEYRTMVAIREHNRKVNDDKKQIKD